MAEYPMIAAVDGSASSDQAVVWAAVEAGLRRRPLQLLTSVASAAGFAPGTTLAEADTESLRRDGDEVLAAAVRTARAATPAELDLETEVTFERITPALIDRSDRASMIVLGSHGRGALRRGLLGSVSSALVRHARCPVAVIHDSAGIDPESAAQPILVGVDGTKNSVPAIEFAFAEAALRGVGVTALHTWTDVTGLDVPVPGWDAVQDTERALLGEQLAGYRERYPDVAVRSIVAPDRPVRALLDESADAQLIVVGSHGRGGFAGMLLGSTSAALVHSAERPIVVVRDAESIR
ncbi:universal stress protein [Nocardia sp. NPDC127579]|uniref:universal stress protein n=1 Tax=Nocardia sp. NPDC127579 TaxID=3345402 RepID=UPI00363DF5B5